jgi:hypothetical protein
MNAGSHTPQKIIKPLKNLNITTEDLADLSGLQPFGPDLHLRRRPAVFPRTRVRMRMTVRYSDYRRFLGKVSIVEEGEPGREN